jgi:hypothetical protein
MMWLHGPSRTGKTLVNFILAKFLQNRAVATVGTQSETTFGKQGCYNRVEAVECSQLRR